jgi:hypothetical protein
MAREAREGFSSIQNEFSSEQLQQKLFPDRLAEKKSWYDKFDISSNYQAVKAHFRSLQVYFKEKTEAIAVWTMKLIAAYLFDCILFPLTFFIILYLFTRSMVRYVLGMSRISGFREDMEAILQKHFKSDSSAKAPHPSGEG